MIRCNDWLVVGALILTVALQGKRTIQEHGGAERGADEPRFESKAVPAQAAEATDEKFESEKLAPTFRSPAKSWRRGTAASIATRPRRNSTASSIRPRNP